MIINDKHDKLFLWCLKVLEYIFLILVKSEDDVL
jgi:hypothetical protein